MAWRTKASVDAFQLKATFRQEVTFKQISAIISRHNVKFMNGGMDPNEFAKLRQIEEMKKRIMATILSKEAYERLARVRVANPELSGQVELYLIQIYQAGKLTSRVSDDQIKEVLKALSAGSMPDFSIRRK